jgi:hypothetical protein
MAKDAILTNRNVAANSKLAISGVINRSAEKLTHVGSEKF